MLRVAIVGCEKRTERHLRALRRIPDRKIVAACDGDISAARKFAERFEIDDHFCDVREMLKRALPDVVHIVTPPQSHFEIAKLCLDAGVHVYVEQPFTVTADEAEELIALADDSELKVTTHHPHQFTLEMLKLRRLKDDGFFGGKAVHLECLWPCDLEDADAGPIPGSRAHWVRQLPGKLLHRCIGHGIARLAEFLADEVEVFASAHQSERLCHLGGEELLDELRVFIRDQNDTTAYFTFSSQIKPSQNVLRILGPANSVTVDQSVGVLERHKLNVYRSRWSHLIPHFDHALDHFQTAGQNIYNFIRGYSRSEFGFHELVARFYHSILNEAAPPIPYREILLTARIMDEIFAQVYPQEEMEHQGNGNGNGSARNGELKLNGVRVLENEIRAHNGSAE
ncbi:MAG TPA: Gfo/Idh/MocA family oxidoreductase [Verrucomicrobiae bacterium]|nr:Gfo/Idh/MocA family oxidoreductase [Verrucomicrobiae bacterium]